VKNRRRAAVLRQCIWDTQPLWSVPKPGKEIWLLCDEKKQKQGKLLLNVGFSALKPSTVAVFPVGWRVLYNHCCAKSKAGTSKRRSNMIYCRRCTTCRATMPACHELPRSRLPSLPRCMPANTTCSSACVAQFERTRKLPVSSAQFAFCCIWGEKKLGTLPRRRKRNCAGHKFTNYTEEAFQKRPRIT